VRPPLFALEPTDFCSRGYRSVIIRKTSLTLRGINETVRNLGKPTTLPAADSSVKVSSTKKGGDQTFVPRSSQSVHKVKNDSQSSRTGNRACKGASTWFLSFLRQKDEAPTHSIRIGGSSNPISHPLSLETAETRGGTDLDIARRHHRQLSNFEIEALPTANRINRWIFDNPIMLEDKDFDSTSEDSDYSSPPSPSRLSIPLDTSHYSAKIPPTNPAYGTRTQSLLPPIQTSVQPPAQLSRSPSSLGPAPATYPMRLRQYLDAQGQHSTIQSPTRQPPMSTQPLSPNRSRPLHPIPTYPTRPPIPSRNPARFSRSATSSEEGHGSPLSYQTPPLVVYSQKSRPRAIRI